MAKTFNERIKGMKLWLKIVSCVLAVIILSAVVFSIVPLKAMPDFATPDSIIIHTSSAFNSTSGTVVRMSDSSEEKLKADFDKLSKDFTKMSKFTIMRAMLEGKFFPNEKVLLEQKENKKKDIEYKELKITATEMAAYVGTSSAPLVVIRYNEVQEMKIGGTEFEFDTVMFIINNETNSIQEMKMLPFMRIERQGYISYTHEDYFTYEIKGYVNPSVMYSDVLAAIANG